MVKFNTKRSFLKYMVEAIAVDLDETLIAAKYLSESNKEFGYEKLFQIKINSENYLIFTRPGCKKFLDWCKKMQNKSVKVGIFSTGHPRYIALILKKLKFTPDFVLSFFDVKRVKQLSQVRKLLSVKNVLAIDDNDQNYPNDDPYIFHTTPWAPSTYLTPIKGRAEPWPPSQKDNELSDFINFVKSFNFKR